MCLTRAVVSGARRGGLQEHEVESYAQFLSALFEIFPQLPHDTPYAIDGNGNFRTLRELYDHSEVSFRIIFKESEKEMFLHPRLQQLCSFTAQDGFCKIITGHHYLSAAKHIQEKALMCNWKEDGHERLKKHAWDVYTRLIADIDSITEDLSFLKMLERVYFVPIRREFSDYPRFRLVKMIGVANRRLFGSFTNCVLPEYVDVCWSQVSFGVFIDDGVLTN